MKEQEWAGPEALCPGWQEEEVPDGEGPGDRAHPDPTAHAYEVLQRTLRLEGWPLTIDRTAQPRTGTEALVWVWVVGVVAWGCSARLGWWHSQAGDTGLLAWGGGVSQAPYHCLAVGSGPLDMTVCILGSPTAFLPILLEGGTRCPGE